MIDDRAARTEAVSAHYPLRLHPERKIYRVGTPYAWRHPRESLAMAMAAFLTAHYRIVHRRVQRFDDLYLAQRLPGSDERRDWATALSLLSGVPCPGPASPFLPMRLLVAENRDDVLSALAEVGPVLMLLPWCGAFDVQSRAYGVDWIGPDGTDLRGGYGTGWRGVLIKGVAWKFKGICIADGQREDLWMPFGELNRLFGEGAKALSAIYTD